MLNQFSRTQLLLGPEGMERLYHKKVAVFGIGGVGGYVCEALVRSGIGAFDLIDTVSGKLEIAVRAKAANIPLISCMGTGNKLDPTKLTVTDIYKTDTCPLAKVMRRELKKRGIDALQVVYSTEPPITPQTDDGEKRVPASISFVPPAAGLLAAGTVIKALLKQK